MAEHGGTPNAFLGVDWGGPTAVGCMAAVAVTVVAEGLFGRFDLKCIAKTTASTCFLVAALTALEGRADRGADGTPWSPAGWSPYGRSVLVGLVLGWLGDVCLLGTGPAAFLSGLACFLAGHLMYIVAFVCFGRDDYDWWACLGVGAAMVPVMGGVHAYIRPYLKQKMVVPVLAYMLVITLM